MTEPSRAVFLSYASQDAQAAQKICEALRAAGIEVWLDQSELRGGDAWDAAIRRQIKSCALFIPVISWNAHTRGEGYFRLEWKLAVDRSHLMASDLPFLVPVVIDDTPNTDERIPERFRDIQWTRLPAGDTSAAFVARIQRLLAPTGNPVADPAPPHSTAPVRADPAHSAAAGGRRGVLYGAIAVVALLALGYLVHERLVAPTSRAPQAASIAVLPLRNESGEPGQQYFSDGISEDLITALSQLPGVKVIGRTSAFQFRDSREDSRSIGIKLGVRHLLEGSVRKSGDVIRVSAELIDTADGSTQWSERYDRPYKDLFTVQDEITHAVAVALRTKLLSGEQVTAQNERPPGGSLDAYNAFLRGRYFRDRHTEADAVRAIESFTQATQMDPRYALAWAELSKALSGRAAEYLAGAEARGVHAQARAAVERALALAPDLATAHVARGFVLQDVDLNWSGAEAEFREALRLSPGSSALSNQLASIGQLDEAIALVRQVLAVEPLRANWFNWLSMYLLGQGHLDEAEKATRRAIELQPGSAWFHQTLTIIEVRRGNAAAALQAAQSEPPGVWRDIAMALATQAGGDRPAAEAALRTLIGQDADVDAYQVAQVYALRNDANATFEWLDRAYANRDGGVGFLLYDPFILRYRDDPRMATFCRKVGLPVPGQSRQQT